MPRPSNTGVRSRLTPRHTTRASIGGFVRGLLVVLLAPAPWGTRVVAGRPADPHEQDAVVATVTEVSDHAATYGNPPRVKLDVHEVLQGDPDTDRHQALWAPPPHDIDRGVLEDNPQYKAWAAKPMQPPAVGSRWILYGYSYPAGPGKEPIFHVWSQAAVPFSEEKRAAAVGAAREWTARRRKLADDADADRRADARTKALWRTLARPEDLRRYAADADVVVTARWVSAGSSTGAIGVQVTSVLKGTLRAPPADRANTPGHNDRADEPPRYLDFRAGPALQVLMDRDTEYLLFLSDAGVTFSHVAPSYPRIGSGDGAVIADEQALSAVRDALRRSGGADQPPPPANDAAPVR